jgi:hypothetical protein
LRAPVAEDVVLGDLDGDTGEFLPWDVADPVATALAEWALLGRDPSRLEHRLRVRRRRAFDQQGDSRDADRRGQHGYDYAGRLTSWQVDGKTLISSNGLRQLRPPSYKPNLDKWQANFDERFGPAGGSPTATSHLGPSVRAAAKRFHSPDADLDTLVPADPTDVGVLVQMMAGPADGPGEESFDVVVCTPLWLPSFTKEQGRVIGRHHLIVESWDWPRVRTFLTHEVEAHEAPTWRDLAAKISRIGKWEFEDYQP